MKTFIYVWLRSDKCYPESNQNIAVVIAENREMADAQLPHSVFEEFAHATSDPKRGSGVFECDARGLVYSDYYALPHFRVEDVRMISNRLKK